jgi:hypothetical protein
MTIKLAQELKCTTDIYCRRWYIETSIGSIRLHHWLKADDDRYFHDHPWSFITFVLKGGYTDITPEGNEYMSTRMIKFRKAIHRHTVKPDEGGCWTIVISGPKIRKWGFWVNSKFKKANKYFLEHGIHICN